jgi:hypothetical protein
MVGGAILPFAAQMSRPGAELSEFLRRARRAAAARRIRSALVDVGLVALAAVLVGSIVAGLTLRGDLAQRALPGVVALGALIVAALAWLGARRGFGRDQAAARTIAQTAAPLCRPDPKMPLARRRAHRALRHEVLGAFELASALREDRRAPPAGLGSAALSAHYVRDVEQRLRRPDIDPAFALPRPRARTRVIALAAIAIASVAAWAAGPLPTGLALLLSGRDERPPVPAEPVWSALSLRLVYPAYTGRPPRLVPNPSGALRAPAGTHIEIEMTARRPAAAGRVVVAMDGADLDDTPPPELVELTRADEAGLEWTGAFTLRASGSWTVVLLDDEDDGLEDAPRRSAALALSQEPDRPPEVELLPLPRDRREVRENETVDVRFTARDDFGLVEATLVYQLPDGTAHRLAVPAPARSHRTWRRLYSWDISQIPIAERSEVLYWIEVRDNDPGLGLKPLEDPPGKVTRSATMRLVVRDDEAEHAENIVKMRDIRDAAVDLLALRLTTGAFSEAGVGAAAAPVSSRAAMARDLLSRSSSLLARIADAIDTLSMDALAHERDIATLTKIHGRLMELHKDELKAHEGLPPGLETSDPDAAGEQLKTLGKHNRKEITQLEDEIIRLDDLVDGQIIERLEALVARLEATQRKIVDLLEQLKAGDESVRSQIEQLSQRRREDMRRIAEARAMLRKEVDEEFMNLDAFAVLQRMQDQEQIDEMIKRGEIDQALEQARGDLGGVQGLRDEVQRRLGERGDGPEMSEEERQRMQLIRELSRLQDDEGTLRAQTKRLHEQWREAARAQKADPDDAKAAAQTAEALREKLDEINDARLGRDARRGLEDAKDALERLQQTGETPDASALDLAEAAEAAEAALQRASEGSQESEREGKAVRKVKTQAEKLRERLRAPLPSARDVLPAEDLEEIGSLETRQRGLEKQASELLKKSLADPLPPEGRKAMRRAERSMNDSSTDLSGQKTGDAVGGQSRAWQGLQEAIDSLRRGSPPPPPRAAGDASTEAERDRSLRDELMDAMREQAPEGYDGPVKRYYEELLR